MNKKRSGIIHPHTASTRWFASSTAEPSPRPLVYPLARLPTAHSINRQLSLGWSLRLLGGGAGRLAVGMVVVAVLVVLLAVLLGLLVLLDGGLGDELLEDEIVAFLLGGALGLEGKCQ